MNLSSVSLFVMSAFYIFAGVSHFTKPKFFLKITPTWVPYPKIVNLIVGALEIGLGIGLIIDSIRSYAAIGIIILLICVFPANYFHYQKARKKGRYVTATLIRLPVQLVLIFWAYTCI